MITVNPVHRDHIGDLVGGANFNERTEMTISEHEARLQIEGRRAYEAGKPIEDCPYPMGTKERRINWMTGWLDSRTWSERGAMLRKYGITDDRPRW